MQTIDIVLIDAAVNETEPTHLYFMSSVSYLVSLYILQLQMVYCVILPGRVKNNLRIMQILPKLILSLCILKYNKAIEILTLWIAIWWISKGKKYIVYFVSIS